MSGLRMHYCQSLLRLKSCRSHYHSLSLLVWPKPIFTHHASQQQQQQQQRNQLHHATATVFSSVTRTKSSPLHHFRFPFSSSSSSSSSSSFGRDSYHHSTTYSRCFSAFSSSTSHDANRQARMVKSQNKLVLGSHKWSSMDPVHYCEIVQTALANGIGTIEAGQGPGALQALHQCFAQMPTADATTQQLPAAIRILQRVGYRTTLRSPPPPPPSPPPATLENEDDVDLLDDSEKQQQATTSSPTTPPAATESFALLPGDVIVEEVPVSSEASSSSSCSAKAVPGAPRAASQTSAATTSFPAGSTTVVLHNISASGIQEAISTSPFITMEPLANRKVETVFMLHNPEVQGGAVVGPENSKSGGLILPISSFDSTNQSRQEAIGARLVESFVALEMAVQRGQIAAYGIVSNGLGLPHDHPLHLSWPYAIRPALERAFQHLNKNSNDSSDGVSSSDNGPSAAVATPRQLLHFSILELPVNLIETTGLQVARQVHKDLRQDAEFRGMFANKAIEIYAMRPLSAYPDLGTGQDGHALVLADYLLPTLTALPSTSTSGVAGGVVGGEVEKATTTTTEESINGGPPPPPRMQWSHTMSSPPEIYNIALQSAMAHFDAEAILEAQQERLAQGEKADLTAEERETLDGCKLMQSLLHDVDIGLDKMRCFAVHERELMQRIIPLIYDTFEEYDDDTAKVLQTFFASYTLAVRYAIAKNTRYLLLHGEDSLSASSNIPIFNDLHPDMKLQEYAIDFILKQQLEALQGPREKNVSNGVTSSGNESGKAARPTARSKDVIDKLVVGCTDPDQVIDDLELVYQFYFRKMQEEEVAAIDAEAREER